MNGLPGLLLTLIVWQTCSAVDIESESGWVTTAGQSPKCPGMCQEVGSCVTALEETDCVDGFICCVDNLEITTEFQDFTTESVSDSSFTPDMPELELEEGVSTESALYEIDPSEEDQHFSYGDEVEVDDGRYKIVYSEESGEAVLTPVIPESEIANKCPGTCIPLQFADDCQYVLRDSDACSPEALCCLADEDSKRNSYLYDFEESSNGYVKRSAEKLPRRNCPGSCVHPSQALYCNRILEEYFCPLNAKCCYLRSNQRWPDTITECKGRCLAFHMNGYCFPPNEIVMGQTTCPPGTNCCMENPSNIQPPIHRLTTYTYVPPVSNLDRGSQILGHLAVDDSGTVFKVSVNGQRISPLPRLPHLSNLKDFSKLAAYPKFDGEIAIYSDATGILYQQFHPRQPSINAPQIKLETPVGQQIHKFESLASENSGNSKESTSDEKLSDTSEDIVIPDDDDEAPVTTNSPLLHGNKSSRPPCPGSCMSYFLRFTCFRGYAIYDGFTCNGRSVCCARLKEIEDHEQYLKSISPYFNVPPASRDSSLPRCGIKGRRDTPRVMGGKDSLPGEWCWQVAVINVHNQYICGGTLIDDSWVLTAAHCVVGPMLDFVSLFVRVGVTDLRSPDDNSKAQTVKVASTFMHHNFNSLNLDNNIALLRLQKPVKLGSNVCVVCLPTSRKMPEENIKCTVTGYGFMAADGQEMSLRIREAQVPLVDDMECMTNVTEAMDNPFILPASSFCAGGEGLEDVCQGDAGGALACEVGGFHELVGLVSWGLGCGKDNVPSIYVKVPAFMGWINQIISSSSFANSLN